MIPIPIPPMGQHVCFHCGNDVQIVFRFVDVGNSEHLKMQNKFCLFIRTQVSEGSWGLEEMKI